MPSLSSGRFRKGIKVDQTTTELSRMISGLRPEELPTHAIQEAQRRLLDSIACAVGALEEPLCEKICQIATRYRGQDEARIWFTGQTSAVEMAGFANGCRVRFLDLSDTVLAKAAGHPSDMIPALVALAESRRSSGAMLLAAIVVAYDLYVGLCEAVAFQKRGVDQSTAAALGAAGGAALLLGLDPTATGNALALALGNNVNLYNVRNGVLSDWKACAGPNAAREGIFAALLAAEGISGPTGIFDGGSGFGELVGGLQLKIDPRQHPKLPSTHLKAWPVCYHGQSATDAATRLAGFAHVDDIGSVVIETYDMAWRAMGNDPSRWAPSTRETADHSLPYVVAVALSTGQLTSADYRRERLADPALRALMSRIEVRADPSFTAAYPGEARSKITLTTRDGRSTSVETIQPKGHVQNPLSDMELQEKFASLWPAERLPKAWQAIILAEVQALPEAQDVTALVDSLCLATG